MGKFTPAEVLAVYGLTLMMVGAFAFMAAGESKKAMTSIYMGNGGALVSFLLGMGVRNMNLNKGESGYKIMMICIHLAFIYPIIFASVVTWRLVLVWGNPAKAYLKPYFGVIIAASLLTSLFIFLEKPKKDRKKDKVDEKETETVNEQQEKQTGVTTRRRTRKASAM